MGVRDEKKVESLLAQEKGVLTKLKDRIASNSAKMHRLREDSDKTELLIEKLTGKPVEKPKVELERKIDA